MEIAVIGTGYVGLVAGTCFADAGHQVTCVDRDENKIAKLRDGIVPIYEPGLEDVLKTARKRMQFTTSLKDSVSNNQAIFIAVGTPEGPDGKPVMTDLLNVVVEIAKLADHPIFLILKSTVPIGTAQQVKTLCRQHSQQHIEVISNPEFLREGAAVGDFMEPDRVVVGTESDEAQKLMREIYEPFVAKREAPILFMDNTSAEMCKYAANSFLAVKISFINELALLADKVGADIEAVRRGFTSDHRINPAFFSPGLGFGGSCFPKDISALVEKGREYDLPMEIVAAANHVNDRQKTILFKRLQSYFGVLGGKIIAIWGLAYKPATDDIREAPALSLIERLVEAGAQVRGYDPVAGPNFKKACRANFELTESAMAAAQGADALVIVTEWKEFIKPDFELLKESLRSPVIFDGRNVYDPVSLRQKGFQYYNIGRQACSQPSKLF